MADTGNVSEIVAELKTANKNMSLLIQTVMNLFTGGATATSATSGAQTLPANPAGFFVVAGPGGTSVKVPYYNT